MNINDTFGRLTVISERFYKDIPSGKRYYVRCRCDCGNEKDVACADLTSQNTRSCGCLHREIRRELMNGNTLGEKHGKWKTRLYTTWTDMKARCYNPNSISFPWYGGRGIKVCDEWKDNFLAFEEWAFQSGYEDNLTIDRIDNDGSYNPSNCQWITQAENTAKKWKKYQ